MAPLSRSSRNQNNYLSLDNGVMTMLKCRGFLSLSLIFTIIIVLLNKEKNIICPNGDLVDHRVGQRVMRAHVWRKFH